MTESHARTVANVVMAAAALGAAVIVLRNPKLRRLAFQFARQYASGPLAAWAATSVRDAWDASGSAPRHTPELRGDRSAPALPPVAGGSAS